MGVGKTKKKINAKASRGSGGGSGNMSTTTYDPAGYADQITVKDIELTVNQAQTLRSTTSGSGITAGQGYIIDNGGVTQLPSNISLMRVIGIDLPSSVKGFSPNAEAYVTDIAKWLPCTYNVATNTVSGEYILYAANLSQIGDGDPTIDSEIINLMGETPVFARDGSGSYRFTISASLFLNGKIRNYFGFVYSGATSNIDSFILNYSRISDTRIDILTGAVLSGEFDAILNNTYFEVKRMF